MCQNSKRGFGMHQSERKIDYDSWIRKDILKLSFFWWGLVRKDVRNDSFKSIISFSSS